MSSVVRVRKLGLGTLGRSVSTTIAFWIVATLSGAPASRAGAPPYDPTNDLNAAFGARCSTAGPLRDDALAKMQSLRSVILQIRAAPECQGLAGSLDALNASLTDGFETWAQSERQQEVQYRREASDLELAISRERERGGLADPDWIAALRTRLRDRQLALIELGPFRSARLAEERARTLDRLRPSLADLISGLQANAQCLVKQPALGAQLASQLLATSSTLAPGLVGLGVYSASSLASRLIGALRNLSLDRAVRDLSRAPLLDAVGCSWESMAATYCESRDYRVLVERTAALQTHTPAPEADLLNLLSRDSEMFLNFAQRLVSGSEPVSDFQADAQNRALDQRFGVIRLKRELLGEIGRVRQILNQTGGESSEERANLVRALADELGERLICNRFDRGNTACNTPVQQVFSLTPDCGPRIYFRSPGDEEAFNFEEGTDNILRSNCGAYINDKFAKQVPSLEQLTLRVTRITRRLEEAANGQVAVVFEDNPFAAFQLIEQTNSLGRSAIAFLHGAKRFLENARLHVPSWAAPYRAMEAALRGAPSATHLYTLIKSLPSTDAAQLNLIEDTYRRVTTAIRLYESIKSSARVTREETVRVLDSLSELLAWNANPVVLVTAIESIARQDLFNLLRERSLDDQVNFLMQISATGGLTELLRPTSRGVDAARAQIDTAQTLSYANLLNSGRVFINSFKQGVELLEKGQRSAGPAAGMGMIALACARLLLVPDELWKNSGDIQRICGPAVFQSVFKERNASITFAEHRALPWDQRVCVVFDFFRSSRLYGLGLLKR